MAGAGQSDRSRLVVVDVDEAGRLVPERVVDALTARTRLLAFSHVSNVLGIVNPADAILPRARSRNVTVLVDAAQSAPHLRLDVQAMGCDFLACSGHKLLGPMGTGILWAKQSTLDAMPPYQLGSNMAHAVDPISAQFEHGALKFQAGTPNVSGAVGLSAAIEALDRFDLTAIRRHDTDSGAALPRACGDPARPSSARHHGRDRIAVAGLHLHVAGPARLDIVKALDERGIAVRAGDMAALPLLRRYGIAEAVRASCYLYTTIEEVDRLMDGLHDLAKGRP